MNFNSLDLPQHPHLQKNRTTRPIAIDDIAAETHLGRVRLCNEDSFGYSVGEENTFVIVADGIGGHSYGDEASQTTVKAFLEAWRSSFYMTDLTCETAKKFLCSQIHQTNQTIYNKNVAKALRSPMGTTLVAGCFLKDTLVLAHLGDSRCYRVRNGRINQITTDHSYVSMLVENHVISPAAAKVHPFSHVICRSIGVAKHAEPELNFFERRPGDRYLFCSDGALIGVDDADIESIIYDAENPHEAVSALIRTALCNGGDDNITVIAVFT